MIEMLVSSNHFPWILTEGRHESLSPRIHKKSIDPELLQTGLS